MAKEVFAIAEWVIIVITLMVFSFLIGMWVGGEAIRERMELDSRTSKGHLPIVVEKE